MRNNELFPKGKNEIDSITYINGLGFINKSQTATLFSLLRANSNIICFSILLFFIFQHYFVLPVTYLVYFFGADIHINYYTGMIVSSPLSKTTITFLVNFISLLGATVFCLIAYRRPILSARLFRAPHQGVTSLAAPMTIAIGFVGVVLGILFCRLLACFGIVFVIPLSPIKSIEPLTFYIFLLGLIFAVLEEILFRGIILTALRQFGDGFAVLAASVIFAVWSGGAANFIFYFFLSLPLCYFAIRSGSVRTPIISRICFQLILFGYQLCLGRLEKSLALVIILLCSILIILVATYCFVTFIKADSKAFLLKPANDRLSLAVKLSLFSSSVVFILLVVFQIIRIIKSTQIIG